jgi:hypothetical protein
MYVLHIDYYFLSTSVISSAKSDYLTDAVFLFIKTSKTKIKHVSIVIGGNAIYFAVSQISCSEKVLHDAILSSNSGMVIFTKDTGT